MLGSPRGSRAARAMLQGSRVGIRFPPPSFVSPNRESSPEYRSELKMRRPRELIERRDQLSGQPYYAVRWPWAVIGWRVVMFGIVLAQ